MHALEDELAARLGDRARLFGVDDRVLLVEHLEDAIGRGARVEQEREQEADRLHRPAQHGGHREERHELRHLQLPQLREDDARAQAHRESDVGQQHQPEPDPADRPGLAELGLAQRLGLTRELLQSVLPAAEGLQHADAVDALLHRGGEVARLILTLSREGAVALLEAVAGVPQRRGGDEEERPQQPVPPEQQHRADEDRQHVDDQQDEAEREPAAEHADVLHHAREQLPRLPAVVERHRQALKARVERLPQVVLDLRRGGEHEPPAQPHHAGLRQAQPEDEHGTPRQLPGVARADGAGDQLLEDERDREGEHARAERADGAEREAREDGARDGQEPREGTERRQLRAVFCGGHDPRGVEATRGSGAREKGCQGRRWRPTGTCDAGAAEALRATREADGADAGKGGGTYDGGVDLVHGILLDRCAAAGGRGSFSGYA